MLKNKNAKSKKKTTTRWSPTEDGSCWEGFAQQAAIQFVRDNYKHFDEITAECIEIDTVELVAALPGKRQLVCIEAGAYDRTPSHHWTLVCLRDLTRSRKFSVIEQSELLRRATGGA